MSEVPSPSQSSGSSVGRTIATWVTVVGLIYVLLVAVGMIGSGFKWASGGKEAAAEIFSFATNPILGLLFGIFATAVVQSSSTVASVIVGLVAGGLPVPLAIPMIMGANIGTTVTNTLVSMAHVTRPQEFRRAFAAATVHDCFNLIAVLVFLPLEILTHFLASISHWMSGLLVGTGDMSIKGLNFVKPITKPVIDLVGEKGLLADMGAAGGVLLAVIGLVLIFSAILLLGKLLKRALVGRAERIFHASVGRGPISGIASGTIITVLVQSSSTTTSLIIPMAGAGMMSLRQVFPFTLGANIGTTVTALLAATGASDNAGAALQIALVHLMFNIFGVLLIYGIPAFRAIPMKAAEYLADMAVRRKSLAISWIVVIYFLLPGGIYATMRALSPAPEPEAPAAEAPVEPGAASSNLPGETATPPATEPADPAAAPTQTAP
ncbi:MAG: Na/Pi symporter [Planctomycetota bacterium]|jgi:sodium-dependent phosphate cotransporter|nr:Na/Pi symporter [Planctomycetota bacterium]